MKESNVNIGLCGIVYLHVEQKLAGQANCLVSHWSVKNAWLCYDIVLYPVLICKTAIFKTLVAFEMSSSELCLTADKERGLRPEQWLSQFHVFLHYLEMDGRTHNMTPRNDHPLFTCHRLLTFYFNRRDSTTKPSSAHNWVAKIPRLACRAS